MTRWYTRNPIPNADLLDFSAWDAARWNLNRLVCDRVAGFFQNSTSDLGKKIYPKLKRCCDRLSFYRDHDEPEGGRHPWKLLYANFCHQRVCLTCQGRLTAKWRKRLNRGIPKIERDYPDHRWVFLTLTIKNMPIEELRGAIAHLNESWRRLTLYGRRPGRKCRDKPFPAVGWIKSIEVTWGAEGTAHPHIHALLFLPPGYFKGVSKYLWSQEDWGRAWQRALKTDYTPHIWLKEVKEGNSGVSQIAEVVKYITKPSDLTANAAWTQEYADQLSGCQLRSIGGVAFWGNPDLAPPREGEDLVGKCNPFAETDERASFRWNGDRLGYDRYD